MSFCIQFFRQHVSIILQHALAFVIERKIALVGDFFLDLLLLLDFVIYM